MTTRCLFTSDLHGHTGRFQKLLSAIQEDRPNAVFLGGDLLPGVPLSRNESEPFIDDFLAAEFTRLKEAMQDSYPRVFLILGNDDPRLCETTFRKWSDRNLWVYAHQITTLLGNYRITGYSFVPPTPFLNKDWERYDIGRTVDPGSVSPEQGRRSVEVPNNGIKYGTIARDLEELAGAEDLSQSVFLFHAPPYRTNLDRAALDGRTIDHVPLDVHVGSIAIRRFIEQRQPLLTLHGHIHESARITGSWRDRIGRTHLFTGAHGGPELALVRFDLEDLESASRELF